MKTNSREEGGPRYGVAPSGHRLPAATRLGRVRLQVADLARSVEFYEQVLGLRVLSRSADAAALGPSADEPSIVELRERPGAVPAAPGGRPGLYHFAILLPDRAALGRLVGHLGSQGVRFGASDHLVSEALYLQDPDGLGIEVYADRPRSAWRHRGAELEMATAPLDVQDLRRSAGNEPWAGMPAGTVIGHVHLHVGDLAEASDFYHQALGLDRMVWSYPGALFLAAGGYHHHLGLNTWAAVSTPAAESDARLLDWEMVLPTPADVHAAVDSLTAAGYPVVGDGSGASVTDPWGTTLRLTAS